MLWGFIFQLEGVMSPETVDGSFTPSVKPLDIKKVGGAGVSTKTSRRVRQREILLSTKEGSAEVTCHTLWMAVQTNEPSCSETTPEEEDVMMLQANAKEIPINKVPLKQQGLLVQNQIPSGGELVSDLPPCVGKLRDETGGNTQVFWCPAMYLD